MLPSNFQSNLSNGKNNNHIISYNHMSAKSLFSFANKNILICTSIFLLSIVFLSFTFFVFSFVFATFFFSTLFTLILKISLFLKPITTIYSNAKNTFVQMHSKNNVKKLKTNNTKLSEKKANPPSFTM